MQAIFLDIERPFESRLVDPSTAQDLGGGVITINRKLFKPVREFSVRSWEKLLRDQMEILRNTIHSTRVSGVIYFDGNQYGDISEPIFIADGNGIRTEFPMPVNNCYAPSWVIKENQSIRTDWTMEEESGTLVFSGTAPTGRITGTGKRKFRVIIKAESEALLSESQIFVAGEVGVYSADPLRLLEVESVNIP